MFASVLIGVAGNVLWTAHGMMMAQITTEHNKSSYFSLFVGILALQLVPGSLASHYLLLANEDDVAGLDGSGFEDTNATGDQSAITTTGTTVTTTSTIARDPLTHMAVGWHQQNSVLFIILTAALVTTLSAFATFPCVLLRW
jgi:hypothetical protein